MEKKMEIKNNEIVVPFSTLDGLELYITGSEHAAQHSFVDVVSQDLMRGGLPIDGGIYDAHMGTTDHAWDCQTCLQDKKLCEGHFGSIRLKYPVLSPLFIKLVIKWLNIICFNCGDIVVAVDKYKPLQDTIKVIAKDVPTKKIVLCVHCGAEHPHVTKDTADYVSILQETYDATGKAISKTPLFPHEIAAIFKKVKSTTVARIGQAQDSHPSNYVLTHVRAPPNTIRPNINKIGGGRSNNNDLTVLMQAIMKLNEKLPNHIPQTIDQEMQILIHNLGLAVFELVRGSSAGSTKRAITSTSGAPLTSIAKRLPSKEGRIRKNLNGKRVQHMARSSITCDPTLPLDTIGVPLAVAKNLQFPEVVRDYNYKQMEIYYMNGVQKYPGCTKIRKARTGATYFVGNSKAPLEIGDTIYRDMIDGDYVNFNRQPSLESSSITAVKVRVMPRGGTIRFNVLICALFGADFDGDEMNILTPQSKRTENEISTLACTPQFFISYKNARPKISLIQDSIIGMASLTETKTLLTKMHAMRIFAGLSVFPVFSGQGIKGRDVITAYLRATGNNINYSGTAAIYNSAHAPFREYDKSETAVVINRGELISGVLDDGSVGGSRGGIFHIINGKNGPIKALQTVYEMQQISHSYQFNRGNTINMADFILKGNTIDKIRDIEAALIADSIRITHQLQDGKIIPPIGKTITEYYESLQMNALDPGDSFWEHILRGINVDTNNFYKMVITGARGKLSNFKNVVAALGGIEINGERMKEIFGGRVLPYFVKDDIDPRSRGYIANSYISGLDSAEFIMHTMEARYQLINKALSTSITGEQNRRAIKNLESSLIDNQRKLAKDRRVIQFLYGGDGVDARSLELVNFPTMKKSMTAQEFEKDYRASVKDFDKKFNNKQVAALLDEEFAQLGADRTEFANIMITFERTRSTPYTDRANLPVNVSRIIDDIVFNLLGTSAPPNRPSGAHTGPKLDPVAALSSTKELLRRVDYVLLNEIQYRQGGKIPQFMSMATKLLKINLRSYLCLKNLLRHKIDNEALALIVQEVVMKFSKSLIAYGMSVGILAAQSISEPMTQMILNSHKSSGIASTKKKGMFRIKEILGARPTDKMKGSSMLLTPIECTLRTKVTEIANHIEMMEFRRFVTNWQLFYEEYGVPLHPAYADESRMIAEFEKYNIHVKAPTDLSNWVLRVEINKSEMIIKQMKLETIYNRLRELYPSLHIVYTHDNADLIVMRLYIRNSYSKKGVITVTNIQELMEELLNTTVRGINGVRAAYVQEANRTTFVDGNFVTQKIYQIVTDGTNIEEILELSTIDPYTVQSDSIIEMYNIFGIECARAKVIDELRNQVDGVSYRHYTIYADEMCYNGHVTGIDRFGSKKRDASFMLRISDAAPLAIIEDCAVNNKLDTLKGVSAPIMLGKAPEIGDLYNSFKIDMPYVASTVRSLDDILSSL